MSLLGGAVQPEAEHLGVQKGLHQIQLRCSWWNVHPRDEGKQSTNCFLEPIHGLSAKEHRPRPQVGPSQVPPQAPSPNQGEHCHSYVQWQKEHLQDSYSVRQSVEELAGHRKQAVQCHNWSLQESWILADSCLPIPVESPGSGELSSLV